MAEHYIVLLGPDGPERRFLLALAQGRQTWVLLVSNAEIAVLTSPDHPHILLPAGRGVILGHLFSKDEAASTITSFTPQQATSLDGHDRQELLTHYWGTYVGVLSCPDTPPSVVRDPSGAVPCYYFRRGEILIATSDAKAAVDARLLAATINWPEVRRHLATSGLRTGSTALLGLKELLPGYRLQTQRNGDEKPDVWWSPWQHAKSRTALTEHELAASLEVTVRSCTRALASRHKKILLNVSGGLDSSIVAAALAGQDVPCECLTLTTRAAQGDERPYARLLASKLGLSLHEAEYQLEDIALDYSQAFGIPRPNGLLFDQSAQERQRVLAQSLGCDAVFSGGGGDNVFAYTNAVTPLLDRLEAEGFHGGIWQTIDDLHQLTGASLWKILRFALRRVSQGGRGARRYIDLTFLNGDVGQIDQISHPLLALVPGLPRGKAAHIAAIARAQVALDFTLGPEGPPTVRPLLAQPVMELCLSIPSWMWITGGIDRAIARLAFAASLPARLIHRHIKGSPDSFAFETLERHRSDILAILRHGVLAQNGLLDLPALETVLTAGRQLKPPHHIRIGALVSAEAWARAWTGSFATGGSRQPAPAGFPSAHTDPDRQDHRDVDPSARSRTTEDCVGKARGDEPVAI